MTLRSLFLVTFAIGTPLFASSARAADVESPVAVLPLVVSATSDDYTSVPKAAELGILTSQVRAGIEGHGLSVIPIEREIAEGCTEAACARQIGRKAGARAVIFGTVAHAAGSRWTTQLTALDVRAGRTIDTLASGALSDYEGLLRAERRLGTCMARALTGKPHCKTATVL